MAAAVGTVVACECRRREVQTRIQAVRRSRLQEYAVLLDSVGLRVPSEENLATAAEVAGALAGTVSES